MITVVSDTHGTDGHRLEGRTLVAVREASLVVHAGDFTTTTVLDAFGTEACADSPDTDAAGDGMTASPGEGATASPDGDGDGDGAANDGDAETDGDTEDDGGFVAVYGNNDSPGVRERLGARAVIERADVRIVVVHGHEHDGTALDLLGRQEGADLVVVGHSHRPGVSRAGAVTVLNPGSHADPRWNRPAHAELEPTAEGLGGRLVEPDGTVISEFDLATTGGR